MINPHGGKGTAQALYDDIKDYLTASGFVITVLHTTHFHHAYDYFKDISKQEFEQYYAIICVSGDGIGHEIMNAFYTNTKLNGLDLRLGYLLGGSACSMATTATEEWNIERDQVNCVWNLTRGRLQQMNIIKYKILNKEKQIETVYGSVGYFFGYAADVDFNSEKFRWMGSFRLPFYGYTKF